MTFKYGIYIFVFCVCFGLFATFQHYKNKAENLEKQVLILENKIILQNDKIKILELDSARISNLLKVEKEKKKTIKFISKKEPKNCDEKNNIIDNMLNNF